MLGDAEIRFGERKNILLNLFLSSAWPDKASIFNFLEHCECVIFCCQKLSKAVVLTGNRFDCRHQFSRWDACFGGHDLTLMIRGWHSKWPLIA